MKGISDFYISDSFSVKVCEIKNEVIIENNGITKNINAGLWYPRGFDFFEGKIYITDSYHFSVKVFDIDGNFIFEFGKEELQEPYGIKVVENIIYVVDKDSGFIKLFDLQGKYINSFEKKMKLPSLIDFDGTDFFVTNTNGNSVEVFSKTGEHIRSISGKMKYPMGIAVHNNTIFVGDEFNKRVMVFEKNGTIIGEIKIDKYISIVKIYKEKIYFYDNKNGIIIENKLSDLEIEKIELKIEKSDFPNRNDLLEKVINKVSDDYLERPRGIAFDESAIWTALFNKKIIVSVSEDSKINNYFSSDIMIDKLAVTKSEIWFLDYFYRKIYVMDKVSAEANKVIGESILKSPIDFKLRENRITVLDSVLKKIVIFNMSGKLLKEFSIEGVEPVAFDFVDEEFFILDKRKSKVYIYKNGIKISEKDLPEAKYPESIAVSEKKEIFIADEVNGRILKLNESQKIEYELTGLSMPKDVVYKEGKIYVADFGNNSIKIYKAR